MLPCAPYISNMCQPVQSDNTDCESGNLIQKVDTEVKISDVKSIKVDLVYPCDLLKNESKLRGSVESLPKEFSTFKPESPDVLRAAKILENSKKCLAESETDQKQGSDSDFEETLFKNNEVERKEQEKLGAISKR